METRTGLKLSMPGVMLRLEGLALLVSSVAIYGWLGYSWWWFIGLFLWPDIALMVYLVDKQTGRAVYNLLHTLTLPLLLVVAGALTGGAVVVQAGLIWLAHIGMDRMVGYGLKYRGEEKETHLQRV
jgi:hypothetical protein